MNTKDDLNAISRSFTTTSILHSTTSSTFNPHPFPLFVL